MKLWKKVSEDRYELFLKEPSANSTWDVVLYIEKDGAMNYSYIFNGSSSSHKDILATDVEEAKLEIEKQLLEETTKTLNLYQSAWQQRISALKGEG